MTNNTQKLTGEQWGLTLTQLQKFGTKVKSKYPLYKELSPSEVSRRILDKYPSYVEIIKKEEAEPEIVDKFLEGHKVIKGISNFLGTTGVGKGLAQGIFYLFTPEGKELAKDVKSGKLDKKYLNDVMGEIATPKEIVGSAIQTGVTAATAGIGKMGTGIKGLAKAAGVGTALSGTSAIGKGLEENKTVSKAITGAIPSAIIGGVLFSGSYLVGRGLEKMTKSAPNRLYKAAIKQSPQDLKKEILNKSPELSKQLLEKGIKGNDNKILSQSVVALNNMEKQISGELKNVGTKTVDTKKIASSLDDLIAKYKNVFGDDGAKAITEIKDNVISKKTLNISDALKLKRDIYSLLSDNAFNIDATLSQKAGASRIVGNALMSEISKQSPVIGKITKDQQMWLRTLNAIAGKLPAEQRSNIISLSDAVLAGWAIGGGRVGGLVGAAGKKVFQTTTFQTNLGFVLDRIGKGLDKLPTDTAGKISKEAVINLLKNLNK